MRTVRTGGDHQITRSEVADQGSGDGSSIVGPGGHSLTKVTVGGAYLRRVGGGSPTAPGGHTLAGGLHANPQATQ